MADQEGELAYSVARRLLEEVSAPGAGIEAAIPDLDRKLRQATAWAALAVAEAVRMRPVR